LVFGPSQHHNSLFLIIPNGKMRVHFQNPNLKTFQNDANNFWITKGLIPFPFLFQNFRTFPKLSTSKVKIHPNFF
jgi:hypothetical protein